MSYVKPSTWKVSWSNTLSTPSTRRSSSAHAVASSAPSSAGSTLTWPTSGRIGTYGSVSPWSLWQWPAKARASDGSARRHEDDDVGVGDAVGEHRRQHAHVAAEAARPVGHVEPADDRRADGKRRAEKGAGGRQRRGAATGR